MSLPLPTLDDRRFDELALEARSLIRSYAPEWTNYNASDPGITLLELFAWLAEMIVYRADQVTDRHRLVFLRLLSAPKDKPGLDELPVDEERLRAALVALRSRTRAVTVDDYEALAHEASTDVARAHCIPRRYLGAGTEAERSEPRPGYVSVIVLPREGADEDALREKVDVFLRPRSLLGTRLHVAEPVWTPVSAELLVARQPDADETELQAELASAIAAFLDPLSGGSDETGWPFGRDVYVSELYELLGRIPSLDYVADIFLTSSCAGVDEQRCVEAVPLWNDDGDQLGLGLAAHHLPLAALDPAAIVVAAELVRGRVDVAVTPAPGVSDGAARTAVKTALRAVFHPRQPPLYTRGPTGQGSWDIGADALRTTVQGLPEVAKVSSLTLDGDPDRAGRFPVVVRSGRSYFQVAERQLADVRVTVEITA
jgi:hypothetical protein